MNLCAAFYIIARKYASSPIPDLSSYYDAMELDEEYLTRLVDKIEKILNDV